MRVAHKLVSIHALAILLFSGSWDPAAVAFMHGCSV
jgi:hypothetical protein